jgi:integrase
MPFRKKGTKNWHYDFQFRGRRFHGSCGTEDYQEAKAVEAEARVQARSDKATQGEFTISQAFGTYYTDVCEPQASSRTSFSQSKMLLLHFDSEKLISSLTNKDLLQFVVKSRAINANGTVNRRLEFMSRALSHMGDFYDAKLPNLDFSKVKTKEPDEVIRELTVEEETRLFQHLRQDLHPMVWFALNSGARQQAMFQLKWSDIGETHITFAGQSNGKPPYKFPITRPMRAFLSSLHRPKTIPDYNAHVLTWIDRNGDHRPFNQNNHWMWTRTFEAAEIPRFRFHDFRHTFATRMLRHSGNLKLVSKLLGHRNLETTAKYAHVLDSDLEAALETFYSLTPTEIPAPAQKIV